MEEQEEARARSEHARALGAAKTPRKTESSRRTLAEARKARWEDPEAKKRFGDAIRAAARRRAEEKAATNPRPDTR
jgi:hypothetical protein